MGISVQSVQFPPTQLSQIFSSRILEEILRNIYPLSLIISYYLVCFICSMM